jgi:hypothetical protein
MELNLNEVLKDQAEALPPVERLKQLSSFAQQQLELEQAIAAKEAEIEELKAKHKTVSETYIPELMGTLAIREVRLENGLILSVKPYYSGKVDTPEAFNWLESHGHGDLIRGEIKMNYPKGVDKQVIDAILSFIKNQGFMADNKISVHHATLSSWLREMIEGGEEINRDVLKVTTGFRAKLSLK